MSTANRSDRLPGSGPFVLTVSGYVDRTGRAYGHALEPDERVAESAGGGGPLAAALAWLGAQPACARP